MLIISNIDMLPPPTLQMVVRIGGKEESGQSTINEEKDGGRAEGKPMRDSGREGGIEEEEA